MSGPSPCTSSLIHGKKISGLTSRRGRSRPIASRRGETLGACHAWPSCSWPSWPGAIVVVMPMVMMTVVVMIMAVVMTMIMMLVVVVLDCQEFGSISRIRSRSKALRPSTASSAMAQDGAMQFGVGVDAANPRFDFLQFGGRDEIDLVEQDDVGEGDLVFGFGRALSRADSHLASSTVTIASRRRPSLRRRRRKRSGRPGRGRRGRWFRSEWRRSGPCGSSAPRRCG